MAASGGLIADDRLPACPGRHGVADRRTRAVPTRLPEAARIASQTHQMQAAMRAVARLDLDPLARRLCDPVQPIAK